MIYYQYHIFFTNNLICSYYGIPMPICIILEHKDDAIFVKSVVLLSPILVVQVHMVKKCVVTFERDGVFWCVALRGYALFLFRGTFMCDISSYGTEPTTYETEQEQTCCFFGHRKIEDTEQLRNRLYNIIEELIIYNKVETFLVGSKSDFDDLCREVIGELRQKYTHIKRVYVRAEYPYISEDYKQHLLKRCEVTYFPIRAVEAGRAVYVERNCEMIDKSLYCIAYYTEDYAPLRRRNSRRDLCDYQPKSGTQLAYEYAEQKKKHIINVAEQ